MSTNILAGLSQSPTVIYVPLGVVFAFGMIMIASLHAPGAKPEGVAKATVCYLLKALGVVLMAASGVQLLYSLMTQQLLSMGSGNPVLPALLLIFTIGLGLTVHLSRVVAELDAASVAVPRLIFNGSLEVIGAIIATVSGLSIFIGSLFSNGVIENWEMPATMLVLGLTLAMSASLHTSAVNRSARKASRRK